ncbi:hypothetical protein V6N11_044870 [Hibiscus sabdariffa]|uniref:Uncharacterized protein n=1 Tax=Hibiscus sabdariffa TaxID=183260 RepID=A0ABR2PU72_9ROSI
MEGNSGVPIFRCGHFYRLPTPATLFLHPAVVGSENGWESGSEFCVLKSLASLAISRIWRWKESAERLRMIIKEKDEVKLFVEMLE